MEDLKLKIKELEDRLNALNASSTIPRNFEMALRERLASGGGKSVTITYVSGVTQDAGTKVITVSTKTMTFVNGILTTSS